MLERARLRLFTLVTSVVIACAAASLCPPVLPVTRIINGHLTGQNSKTLPFLAALFDEEHVYRCSALLISSKWLLSAAHCGISRKWTVMLGGLSQSTGTEYMIKKVYVPQPFNVIQFDIAAIKLTTSVRYSDLLAHTNLSSTESIKYPGLNTNSSNPVVGSFTRALGYGAVTANGLDDNTRLYQVDVPIVEADMCNNIMQIENDSNVCAGYTRGGCDACSGDSGGPLLQFQDDRPVIMGIVSRGSGCALRGRPGIYTGVGHYADWLSSQGVQYERVDSVDVVLLKEEDGSEPHASPDEVTMSPVPEENGREVNIVLWAILGAVGGILLVVAGFVLWRCVIWRGDLPRVPHGHV